MTDPRCGLDRMRLEGRQRVATLRNDVGAVIFSAGSTTGDDEHDPEGTTIGFERAQAITTGRRPVFDMRLAAAMPHGS